MAASVHPTTTGSLHGNNVIINVEASPEPWQRLKGLSIHHNPFSVLPASLERIELDYLWTCNTSTALCFLR